MTIYPKKRLLNLNLMMFLVLRSVKKKLFDVLRMIPFGSMCSRNKLIGNIYLASQEFDTWKLGYVFNPEFQGKGYATEAARVLIEYAFKEKHAIGSLQGVIL